MFDESAFLGDYHALSALLDSADAAAAAAAKVQQALLVRPAVSNVLLITHHLYRLEGKMTANPARVQRRGVLGPRSCCPSLCRRPQVRTAVYAVARTTSI
jgi:hypothetical protein